MTALRKYQPNDVDDILSCWESASAIGHPFVSEEFLASERHNIPNVYLPHAETWVWELDKKVVGFLALIGNEIGGIFVDGQFQRQGIGEAFIEHAKTLHDSLEVDVFKQNTVGCSFYEKREFVLLEEKIHEATGLELLRLKL